MKAEVGIWNKLTRVVIFLLCVAGVLALGLWYFPVIKTNERLRKDIHQLQVKLQEEQENGRRLTEAINALTHDSKAAERLVREKFGYAHPDETVIRFDQSPTNPSPVYP